MSKALVLLAEGVEEMEAVIVIDVLRRTGVEVVSAATGPAIEVTASRGVRLIADALLSETSSADFDALLIPGGAGGSRLLARDPQVLGLIRSYVLAGKLVAAVCAGPLVLHAAGVLRGVRFTCHPAARAQLPGVEIDSARVVADGNFITSQGPGTSMEFALAIARRLVGEKQAAQVAEGLLLPEGTKG
ncbi:MAG: DJ-1 family glyoxalase III [Kiritimatiellia bacterium]